MTSPPDPPPAVAPTAPPALRDRAVQLAAQWVHDCRRVDMQALAAELGVSRVTLFRHVGGRDALLGAALWQLTERTLRAAERRWERCPDDGSRCAGTMRRFNALVTQAPGLRRLLDDEPAVAVRVLTDPQGAVQPGVVAFFEGQLRRDAQERALPLLVDPATLAFALVRLGEAFLYADVLAARTPDVDAADRLQRVLVEGAASAQASRRGTHGPDVAHTRRSAYGPPLL